MPKKIAPEWIEATLVLHENNRGLSAEAIANRFKEFADKHPSPPGRPSARTIRRLLDEHQNQRDRTTEDYRFVSWPESFERGDLPWEAARPMLDLLRYYRERGFGRPHGRVAKWYWRLCFAYPDSPDTDALPARETLARSLAGLEIAGGKYTDEGYRVIEQFLILWQSGVRSETLTLRFPTTADVQELTKLWR